MIKNVNKTILFLNKIWDESFYKSQTTNVVDTLNRTNLSLLNKVVNKLNDNNSYDAYKLTPSVSICTGNNPSISINRDIIHVDRANCYCALPPAVNSLIRIISKYNCCDFGAFITEWNNTLFLMDSRFTTRVIANNIYEYETNWLHYWKNFDDSNIKSYSDAKKALTNDAKFLVNHNNTLTHQESIILHEIIQSYDWWNLIRHFAQHNPYDNIAKQNNTESIANIIKQNATKIAQHGSSNSKIINYLAKLNILCGADLQQKIVDAINDNATGFKSTYHYGIALSKIPHYHTFYRYSTTNICDIHALTGKGLIRAVDFHLQILEHYHSLLKKQEHVKNKIAQFRRDCNLK